MILSEASINTVEAGYYAGCASVGATGKVECWGINDAGLVGDGTTAATSVPVDNSVTGATQIEMGLTHACALTSSDKVYCWGNNDHGQLGDGTTDTDYTPVEATVVAEQYTVESIAVMYDGSTCVGTQDGAVLAWGSNDAGQLGDGTTADSTAAVLNTATGFTGSPLPTMVPTPAPTAAPTTPKPTAEEDDENFDMWNAKGGGVSTGLVVILLVVVAVGAGACCCRAGFCGAGGRKVYAIITVKVKVGQTSTIQHKTSVQSRDGSVSYEQTTSTQLKTAEKVISVTVDPSSTVGQLKELLKDETGHVPAHQVLSFMNKAMDDDSKSLSNYRVGDQDEIVLTTNLPGINL
mmetsp:Transcript_46227/g.128984  ORF Transcript_46227/g.128984 Transcript_46227/m.128984 type:complete len:349 (-) Transcript_46227:187-1233(-)